VEVVGRRRRALTTWWSILALALFASAVALAQSSPALRVTGEVPNHIELSIADIAAFPHQTIHVTDDKGAPAEYSGVPVATILQKAGAPLGNEMKGANMAMGLIARAPDGYKILFSSAEFDPAFSDRTIWLADRRDGKPLDSREGPLRIVVPGDKRHARWIRGVATLEILKVR
jgi:DMSO/TMAO reductase YedYZ molybdopterin-dependent catalytic subunit